MNRPDVKAELARLKDFQHATVEYCFRRLYLDQPTTNRFLIADEVGLGKTLIARGIVAKAIDYLWDQCRRIDIVYVCSNADIARQNVNRLNLLHDSQNIETTRITMLPVRLSDLDSKKVNFVPFTPGTAFELGNKGGWRDERAVLYWLLNEAWALPPTPSMNVLQYGCGPDSFRWAVSQYDPQGRNGNGCRYDRSLVKNFVERLAANHDALGKTSLRTRFERLCEAFPRHNSIVGPEIASERRRLIGELRTELAASCIHALEPDVIILDEFQRFKHLLHEESEENELARHLFQFKGAKTILLSATPYKMYTMNHESESDDHYKDFCETLDFLYEGKANGTYRETIEAYRRELLTIESNRPDRLLNVKDELVTQLRKVMVRTERLAVTPDRNGMLKEVAPSVSLDRTDLRSFVATAQIAETVGNGSVVEYWKSAPYLLNFMDGYKFKTSFVDALADQFKNQKLAKTLTDHPQALLSWGDVSEYGQIDPNNARLRELLRLTVAPQHWKLLWIPPSLPYHSLAGPFGAVGDTVRKFLIFSSWQVVPKVIATLCSYEAERAVLQSFDATLRNSADDRKALANRLRFAMSEGAAANMPVFAMVYPSRALAEAVDPKSLVSELASRLSTTDALEWATGIVARLLEPVLKEAEPSSQVDERWYWAVPLILDANKDKAGVLAFLNSAVHDDEDEEVDEEDSPAAWIEHVNRARDLVEGKFTLGRPPADLAQVTALFAMAGPGTVGLRSLQRVKGVKPEHASDLRFTAYRIADAFRRMLNFPECTAVIRGLSREEPLWQRVLEYCHDGCLQSVFDEFMHVTIEKAGLFDFSPGNPDDIADLIAEFESALLIRAASPAADDIRIECGKVVLGSSRRLRTRFAAQFSDGTSDESKRVSRKEQLRDAFNSPFWPFVLSTTSVGQEGLDFHAYCHSVMHWNLPSNPVDMEQREGRVHRYKGLAVRKNLAKKYGSSDLQEAKDPWSAMFNSACADRKASDNDLVPFWVLQTEGGVHIERYLPFLPLSKDIERLEQLRRALWLYRMVFGQARQDELLANLEGRIPTSLLERLAEQLRVDLSPPDLANHAAAGNPPS